MSYDNRAVVRRVLLITLLLNIFVMVLKAVVGTLTGSLSLLADALHSVTDSANVLKENLPWLVDEMAVAPEVIHTLALSVPGVINCHDIASRSRYRAPSFYRNASNRRCSRR